MSRVEETVRSCRIAAGVAGLFLDRLRGRRRPFVLNHLVTVRCNLNCPFCYVSGPAQREYNSIHYPKQLEMSTDEVRAFYRQLVKLGFKIVIIVGGEPLLRNDLDELLGEFFGKAFITVITNGVLLADRVELVRKASNLIVSLDAPDEQHDLLRASPGAFRRALQGIEKVRQLYPGIRLTVNMTVVKANVGRVPEMIRFVRELGVAGAFQPPSYSGQFELAGRPISDSRSFDASDELAEPFRQISEAAARGERIIGSRGYFDLVMSGRATYPCLYPTYALGPVQPNGDVVGCVSSQLIGSIRTTPVAELLESQPFRANARDGQHCPHGCRDWGIYDLSAVFSNRFGLPDAARYHRAFVK